MGNEDDGLLLIPQDVLQQLALGVGIERTGSLVQQDDAAGAQQCTRYGNALGLSLRESPTLFGKRGIESVGQLVHEVGTGQPQCFAHLLVGGIGSTYPQVVAQRTAQQSIALWHVDEVATMKRGQPFLSSLPHREGLGESLFPLINRNLPFLRANEGEEQSDKCGLASPRLAQDGGAGARGEVVVGMGHGRTLVLSVAIAHVAEAYAAGSLQHDGFALLFFGHLLQFHESFG